MDVAALLDRMRSRRDYAGQIEHVEVLAQREGKFPIRRRRCRRR